MNDNCIEEIIDLHNIFSIFIPLYLIYPLD